MELTNFTISGIRIAEPVTTATDLLTGMICFYCHYRLQSTQFKTAGGNHFKLYFLFLGLAVTSSAIFGHAFQYRFGEDWKIPGWLLGATAIALLEIGTIQSIPRLSKSGQSLLLLIPLIKYALITVLLFFDYASFIHIRVNSAIGVLGFALPVNLYLFKMDKQRGYKILILSICASIFPAIVYQLQFSIHKWFNYHDLSHVLMGACVFGMFRGYSLLFNSPSSFKI